MSKREVLFTSLSPDLFNPLIKNRQPIMVYQVVPLSHYYITEPEKRSKYVTFKWDLLYNIFETADRVWIEALPTPEGSLIQGSKNVTPFSQRVLDACSIFTNTEVIYLQKVKTRDNLRPHRHRSVTSIQSMKLTKTTDANECAQDYINWLPTVTRGLVQTTFTTCSIEMNIRLGKSHITLLRLTRTQPFTENLASYAVTEGLLTKSATKIPTGYFQFLIHRQHLFTALTHFQPALWWPIYRCTQGPIHALVMHLYKKRIETR
ncbi:hypothetical protein [Alteribacter populi]|uniref:hypothetical protein n=1 Tax=Alteribacter populi TaxID=2011011 RepID=UPI000BBB0D99|nr:hypothetical protein [Alteribacter populi]